MRGYLLSAAALVFLISTTARADRQTRIMNLSDRTLYVASMYYHKPEPRAGGDVSTTQSMDYEGWRARGWKKLSPGEGYVSIDPDEYFYIQNEKREEWVPNGVENAVGYLHQNKAYDEFLGPATYDRLAREGFEKKNFHRLRDRTNGQYFGVGNTWELKVQKTVIDEHSHSRTERTRDYSAPGSLLGFDFNLTNSHNVAYRLDPSGDGRSVRLQVNLGGNTSAGGGQKESKMVGDLTIFYSQRR